MPKLKVLPVLDEDGYPTQESLEGLRAILAGGDGQRAVDAFYLALTVNRYGFCGPTHKEVRGQVIPLWEYHTGGWSGHEAIIEALASSNRLLWGRLLQRYDAGGHYYFHSPFDSPYYGTRPSPKVMDYLLQVGLKGGENG